MSAPPPVVLVVEDEPDPRTSTSVALAAHGYRAIEARTAAEGIRLAVRHRPDIVLLDPGLPDADGSVVTRRIREWSIVPILIISARGSEAAKVRALDDGADDYVTKPFGAAEMMARIRVALRHAARSRTEPIGLVRIGEDIRVDLPGHSVTLRGEPLHLTPIEFKLLAALIQRAGTALTCDELLDAVWGPGHRHETNYLRVHMVHLRHKLEREPAHPEYLMTERGFGYRLRLSPR
jgi:two-component system, OmpR family, KDP operon response regulator KdpE